MKCMYLSNTTLFGRRDIYRIHYIKINYMFQPLTMAIFRLRLKNLVSSYTRHMWAVYSGEVRGEVGTRSHMCCVGWVVWVHGVLLLYVMTRWPLSRAEKCSRSLCNKFYIRVYLYYQIKLC